MITDRTQADVNRVNLLNEIPTKGAYNYTDLNRVESKVKELNDLLVKYNYMSELITKLDWTTTNFFTQSDSVRYLNNVKAIRQALTTYSTTPQVPSTMAHLTYQGANDIERVLVDIERLVAYLEAWQVYSGVANSGQNRVWQNRFRHFAIRETTISGAGNYFPTPTFNKWIFDSTSATNDTDINAVFSYEEEYNRVWKAKNLTTMYGTDYTAGRAFTAFGLTTYCVRATGTETNFMLTLPQSDRFKPTKFSIMFRYSDTVVVYGLYDNGASRDTLLDTTTTYNNTQTVVDFTPQDTGKYYMAFEFYFKNQSGTSNVPQIQFAHAQGQLRQNVYRLYSSSWGDLYGLTWENLYETWGDFN